MQDVIPLNEDDNIGGLECIEFALVDDIETIPDATAMLVASGIVMKTGKRFYEAPYTLDSAGFNETSADSEAGTSYSKSINIFVPCDCDENAALFDEMENARFVVIATDRNERKRIVGSIAAPLQFKVDRNTQTTTDGTPGVNATWFGDGDHQAYFYDV